MHLMNSDDTFSTFHTFDCFVRLFRTTESLYYTVGMRRNWYFQILLSHFTQKMIFLSPRRKL